MDEPLSFGVLVRRRRKALDLTQRALAHRVGCAEVTIQKIEAEERRPSTDVAQRLADAFGLTDQPRAAFLRRARGQLDAQRSRCRRCRPRPRRPRRRRTTCRPS